MRKIITFLGKNPKKTGYIFKDKVYHGSVFAEALYQFVDFDKMLVFVTREAKESSWSALEALHDPRIVEVSIEIGSNTAQLWSLLDSISAQVEHRDTVIFDITHGLRSIPFLVFLFAAYLKAVRQVEIEAIYYGAFELQEANQGYAPVIDLSVFTTMLDWITATDQFIQTGDGRWLAGLLNVQQLPDGSAAVAAANLTSVSQAALLCQPFTMMEKAITLETSLKNAEAVISSQVLPFHLLFDRIIKLFESMQLRQKDDFHMLQAQYQIIKWFHSSHQIIQAVTLLREWLIDMVSVHCGQALDFQTTKRIEIELGFTGVLMLGREQTCRETGEKFLFSNNDLNEYGRLFNEKLAVDEIDLLKKIWDNLQPVRNAFNHAEHQKGGIKFDKAIKKLDEIIMPAVDELVTRWGVR